VAVVEVMDSTEQLKAWAKMIAAISAIGFVLGATAALFANGYTGHREVIAPALTTAPMGYAGLAPQLRQRGSATDRQSMALYDWATAAQANVCTAAVDRRQRAGAALRGRSKCELRLSHRTALPEKFCDISI
jgi:hypothetical protein